MRIDRDGNSCNPCNPGTDLALLTKDYLHSLQVRNKWSKPDLDVKVNDLVIIRNPLLVLSSWKLTRVVS